MITIVVIGTWLHIDGQASVGEIVSFMGFATLLIGRLESAVVVRLASLFFKMPAMEDFFAVLDAGSSVPEPGGRTGTRGRRAARSPSRTCRSPIRGGPTS